MRKNKYRCSKCGFEYRFESGAFKQIDKAAARELKKCPNCEVKMEVR
jgi:rubredoxin